jgi:hypothetical protein
MSSPSDAACAAASLGADVGIVLAAGALSSAEGVSDGAELLPQATRAPNAKRSKLARKTLIVLREPRFIIISLFVWNYLTRQYNNIIFN